MKHIVLPDNAVRPLEFYLAMEEVCAHHFDDECFYTWVVRPTVIFGRHQDMMAEVNVAFCRENGIQMVRRKSGGGCVYADEGNIMMSYITPTRASVQDTFKQYLNMTVDALNKLGINAEATGRNDIAIDGRKISGSALYTTAAMRHTMVHGTLLHSTDIERMVSAITPSREKLASKGVKSVRARVMNVSEVCHITIPELRRHLAQSLCDGEICLTTAQVAEVETLMREYQSADWIAGKFADGDEQYI